jgi:hypothetical protein
MGLLASVSRPSGPTLGRPPLFLSAESKRRGTNGTKPHHTAPLLSEDFLHLYV